LLLDIDPIDLVRKPRGGHTRPSFALRDYVNERPYVASSMMSTALRTVFSTALAGTCKDRPDLVKERIPLEVGLPVVADATRGELVHQLFEPMGYTVTTGQLPAVTGLGATATPPFCSIEMQTVACLSEVLAHLYILIPVLDDQKHYWVGDEEVEKLVRHGMGWLEGHPLREQIALRYLRHQRRLARSALAALDRQTSPSITGHGPSPLDRGESLKMSLSEQRYAAVVAALRGVHARTVLDLGCGEGRLIERLLAVPVAERIVGCDVSARALRRARKRLERRGVALGPGRRVHLIHGSALYQDERFRGFDAIAAVDVLEHLEPERIATFVGSIFGDAKPCGIVLTTPNAEYNALFPKLPRGDHRHIDHRFEWTRDEFAGWATEVGERHGYSVCVRGIGDVHEAYGQPTQMAVFRR
jgi:3' terminal RNA ribose 2'-O-methyltransferase Hen1